MAQAPEIVGKITIIRRNTEDYRPRDESATETRDDGQIVIHADEDATGVHAVTININGDRVRQYHLGQTVRITFE